MKRPTKTEAAARLRERAFRVTDLESDDYGRQLIHCRGSFTGADWDLDDALSVLSKAKDVAWVRSVFGHDLAVLDENGKTWCFDVPSPDQEAAE